MKYLSIVLTLFALCGCTQPEVKKKPKLSIITSVWKADTFIDDFLKDITAQTIFPECELILINPDSPGSEESVILEYQARYPNIVYKRLPKDYGIFYAWNEGIKLAQGEFLMNANVDDRSHPESFAIHVKELEAHPEIDLVYASYAISTTPNENFAHHGNLPIHETEEFTLANMRECLPGMRPVWRKSLHDRFGLFDESFRFLGDYAMWLKVVERGAQFKKIPGVYTIYYVSPTTLSFDPSKEEHREIERAMIALRYQHVFTQ